MDEGFAGEACSLMEKKTVSIIKEQMFQSSKREGRR